MFNQSFQLTTLFFSNTVSEFLQLLNSLQVSVIDAHQAWSTLPKKTVETFYQPDGIHLTVSGHQAIADLLFEQLCTAEKLSACSH